MLLNALDVIGRRDIGRLLEVLLPLQSHLPPFPRNKKKSQAISVYALTKGKRSKRQLSKSLTVVISALATRLVKPNICYLYTDGHTDRHHAPWIHMILLHYVNIPHLLTSTYCKYLAPYH